MKYCHHTENHMDNIGQFGSFILLLIIISHFCEQKTIRSNWECLRFAQISIYHSNINKISSTLL